MDLVLDLAGIRGEHASRVGPKMARLGELRSRGWPVPDGYAITAPALADPSSEELHEAVARAHERLQDRTGHGPALRVAVRSSAVGEDGPAASYAGQYDTYLGVTGIADVLRHVRKCVASGETDRARAYRQRFGSGDIAVGVMQLIDARSAGVVFTLNPVTGDRGRLVVEANWGFGESVVGGHVTPDYWALDRGSGQILERRAGATRQWSTFGPAADGGHGQVTLQPLPGELAGRPSLDDEEVRYICDRAAEIEAAEGVPQDVEWVIARGLPFPDSLFIVQHRPETVWAKAGEQEPAPGQSPSSVRNPADPAGDPRNPPGQREEFDPVKYALRNVFRVPGA